MISVKKKIFFHRTFRAEFCDRVTIGEITRGINDRGTTRSEIFRPRIKRKISNTARARAGTHPRGFHCTATEVMLRK